LSEIAIEFAVDRIRSRAN